MKNIVVFNEFSIFPPMFGGQVRIYNIYKNLAQQYNVTYICFGHSKFLEKNRICDNFLEIKIPKSSIHKNANKVAGKLLGVSVDDIIAMFLCSYNHELNGIADEYIEESDIVIFSHPYMFPLVRNNTKNKLLVYESHNVESLLKKSMLGNSLLRDYACKKVKLIEKDLCFGSDLVFVTSKEDMDTIQKIYGCEGSKIHIAPNGVDTDSFDFLYEGEGIKKEKLINQPIVIFLGSGHPPNVQAAKIIINEIAPQMKDVYFLICGSVCWRVKNEYLGKNVGLTFEVTEEEKLELYRVSDVAINPMISGSGTNIKMLDYMSASLPVVSTPVGARGLNLVNNENAFICEISEIPSNVRKILRDKELYRSISSNGRSLVEKEYDWKKIALNMHGVLDSN